MDKVELGPGRAIWGLCLGALSGACLVVAGEIVLATASTGQGPDLGSYTPVLIISFFCALVVYAAGLVLIGAPAWAVLHALRARSWQTATLLGAALNGGVVLLLGLRQLEARNGLQALAASVSAFAVAGAVIGWVIWRVAYRRARPDIEHLS